MINVCRLTLLIWWVLLTGCQTGSEGNRDLSHRCQTDRTAEAAAAATTRDGPEVVYDDLEWLVGKWRCVRRELPKEPASWQIYEYGPAHIELFVVYYPFDSFATTLALERIPKREIIADFVVKKADGTYESTAEFIEFAGRVYVGIDTIALAREGFVKFTYEYRFDEDDSSESLLLRSEGLELAMEKVSDNPGDEAYNDYVASALKQKRSFKWARHQFQKMKFERMNGKWPRRLAPSVRE